LQISLPLERPRRPLGANVLVKPNTDYPLFVTLVVLVGCNNGLVEAPAAQPAIVGRLSFVGDWPQEVGQVTVAVYQEVPQSLDDFFAISGWDTEVTLGAQSYDYYVSLEEPGAYRWIVVAWRREDSFWDFSSLLSCYHVVGDMLPTPVVVDAGQVVDGIDIEVDFEVFSRESIPGISLCERLLPSDLFTELGAGG
jgi:hypothetical protein